MERIAGIADLRRRLAPESQSGKSIGLAPTMGALHAGHARLIEECRGHSDTAVVSIFVNPLQFDRADDFEQYPQTLAADLELCSSLGVDVVFAPTAREIYPEEPLTFVEVPALTRSLCGPFRPGHFRGVATVVTKLLNIVQPGAAWFGEKDAQQLAIIRRLVRDLCIPVTVVAVPTVREADGLALSSRNKHLDAEQRRVAPVLYQTLCLAAGMFRDGVKSPAEIRSAVRPAFESSAGVRLEYFELVHPETLEPVDTIDGPTLIAGAIWLGATRLIDNVTAKPLPHGRGSVD